MIGSHREAWWEGGREGGREREGGFTPDVVAALFVAKWGVLDVGRCTRLVKNVCACHASTRTYFGTFEGNFEKRVCEKWVCMESSREET